MHRVLLLTGVALLSATLLGAPQTSPSPAKTPDPAAAPALPATQTVVPSPESVPATAPVPVPGPVVPTPLPAVAATTVPTSPAARVFASEAGIILNPIKPAQATAFESVIQKLKEALARSDDAVRRQQANGWKVYRAAETAPDGTMYYLFVIDPVVKGADYTIAKVLYEAYPTQVDALLKQFLGSYAGGQTMLNLTVVSNLRIGAK